MRWQLAVSTTGAFSDGVVTMQLCNPKKGWSYIFITKLSRIKLSCCPGRGHIFPEIQSPI